MTTAAAPDVVERLAAPDEVEPVAGRPVPTWEDLVRDHGPRVYRVALRLTGNPHDAEDLTQDTFVRAFRSIDATAPEAVEAWLHRITTNLFLDAMRRRKRIRFDGLGDDAEERYATREAGPEQAYADVHFDSDIERALAALPPQFRVAVVLCDVEGLTYDEIADVLGIKLGTVRSRIHRGRALLRSALAHRDPAARRRTPSLPSLPTIPNPTRGLAGLVPAL